MKKLLLALLLFLGVSATAQDAHPMYIQEINLMEGNIDALFKIAPYLDDHTSITQYLGYHVLTTQPANVTRRIIEENTLFLPTEIVIDSTLTTKKFTAFLKKNKDKIVFDEYAQAFLITPLSKRSVTIGFRQLSDAGMQQLRQKGDTLLKPQWVSFSGADVLLANKDPQALLVIASELFKKRYRFNRSYRDLNEFTDLLGWATGLNFGAENEQDIMVWRIDQEFYPDTSLHLLAWFVQHYNEFTWDEKQQRFVNNKITATPPDTESLLFEQLFAKNDSIALNSFVALTESNPKKVTELAKEMGRYYLLSLDINRVLPQFTDRFLTQMAYLTQYCRDNNIDYKGTEYVRQSVNRLMQKLSFTERRTLEDELIETLTLNMLPRSNTGAWCMKTTGVLVVRRGAYSIFFTQKTGSSSCPIKNTWTAT